MAAFACLFLGLLTTIAGGVESTLGSHLRVATFNLRYAGTKSPNHAVPGAREKGAQLIRNRLLAMKTELPILLLGNFNAEPGREPTYSILTRDGAFQDAWTRARTRQNEGLSTFHDFNGAVSGNYRIDWILTSGSWAWDRAEIVVFSRRGQFPSDHHPVIADLRW